MGIRLGYGQSLSRNNSSGAVYAAGANAIAVWKFLDETTAYTYLV